MARRPEQAAPARVIRVDRFVMWSLLRCSLGLVGLHGLIHNLPFAPSLAEHDNPIRLYFDLVSEANFWVWFNVAVLLSAGVMQLIAGLLARARGIGLLLPWLVSAVLITGLSIDDLTFLHERLHPLGVRLGGGSGLTYAAWLIPGLFFAAIVVAAIVFLATKISREPRFLLLLGLGLFLGGAFGLEAVGNAVFEAQGVGTAYAVLIMVEELAEACGAVLLLASPLAALRFSVENGSLAVTYRG